MSKSVRLQLTTPLLKESKVLFPEQGCEELIEQFGGAEGYLVGKMEPPAVALDGFALMHNAARYIPLRRGVIRSGNTAQDEMARIEEDQMAKPSAPGGMPTTGGGMLP